MYRKALTVIFILGFSAFCAEAWNDDNPWRNSLWSGTGNASGLNFKPVDKFHRLWLGGELEDGNFSLTQEGTGYKSIDFCAEGTARIGKAFLWGSFNFGNSFRDGAVYNTMLFDPRPDMPYYVADVNSSPWRYQTYDLKAKVSYPLGEKLALGLDVGYCNGFGAKQIDPRSSTYVRDVYVGPSISFKAGEKHIIGFNLLYDNDFERSTPTLANTNVNQTVAIMRGLGNCITGTVGGGTLKTFMYRTNAAGAGVQYNYSASGTDLLAALDYKWSNCDVTQNPNKPEPMGRTRKSLFGASFGLRTLKHRLDAHLSYGHTDGMEFVKVNETSAESQTIVVKGVNTMSTYDIIDASAEYRFMPAGEEGPWMFGANASYYGENDLYTIPQCNFNASYVRAGLAADRKVAIGKTCLEIYLEGGFRLGLSGDYMFTGTITSAKLQAIKDDFYPSMATYYAAKAPDARLRLAYGIPIKKNTLRILGNAAFIKPLDSSAKRLAFNLGVEFRF